jgi:hypothetical protein
MRNRFVVLFSVFVVFLIVLLPSLSAVQIRSVEKTFQSKSIEQKDIIDIKDFGYKLKVDCFPKHPILFSFVKTIFVFRMFRAYIYFYYSMEYHYDGWQPYWEIIHPLLFIRCWMLFMTCELWYEFWSNLSDFYGWDWEF